MRTDADGKPICMCGQPAVWVEATFSGRGRPPRYLCNSCAPEYAASDINCTLRVATGEPAPTVTVRTGDTFELVEAPGDACGNTKRLPDGSRCPGCRACA